MYPSRNHMVGVIIPITDEESDGLSHFPRVTHLTCVTATICPWPSNAGSRLYTLTLPPPFHDHLPFFRVTCCSLVWYVYQNHSHFTKIIMSAPKRQPLTTARKGHVQPGGNWQKTCVGLTKKTRDIGSLKCPYEDCTARSCLTHGLPALETRKMPCT